MAVVFVQQRWFNKRHKYSSIFKEARQVMS